MVIEGDILCDRNLEIILGITCHEICGTQIDSPVA